MVLDYIAIGIVITVASVVFWSVVKGDWSISLTVDFDHGRGVQRPPPVIEYHERAEEQKRDEEEEYGEGEEWKKR
jgi:hypothetical protein